MDNDEISHDQLYVDCSWFGKTENLYISPREEENGRVKNVVCGPDHLTHSIRGQI